MIATVRAIEGGAIDDVLRLWPREVRLVWERVQELARSLDEELVYDGTITRTCDDRRDRLRRNLTDQ